MPRELTTSLKQSSSRVDNEDFPIMIVQIDHFAFSTPVRLCDNSEDVTSNGNLYSAIGMRIIMPSDSDTSSNLGATITIDNVGRELVSWLESTGGGAGALITLGSILPSDLDEVSMSATFNLVNITMDMTSVTGTMTRPDISLAKSVQITYTPTTTPGLF